MPRIVDHAQRREELAQAVWRVVLRDGAQHASVRSVAREAGRSAGSLRHYFTTQAELLAFAMRLVTERVRARVQALPTDGSPVDVAARWCEEVLPLDPQRRAEGGVWLALTGTGLADPELRAIRAAADDGVRLLCGRIVGWLREPGDDVETERLHALLDGLALHLLLASPADPDDARRVLRHHLTDLRASAT